MYEKQSQTIHALPAQAVFLVRLSSKVDDIKIKKNFSLRFFLHWFIVLLLLTFLDFFSFARLEGYC